MNKSTNYFPTTFTANNVMIFSSWKPQYNIGLKGDKAVVGMNHSDHFKIVPGLCKQKNTVSIESVLKKGIFLVFFLFTS